MTACQRSLTCILVGTVCCWAPAAAAREFQVTLTTADGKRAVTGVVDTDLDSFTITSWVDKKAEGPWTPVEEALPLTLFAYDQKDTPVDVPENWSGALGRKWAFLLPVGRDIRDVGWLQGEVSASWAGASFGWGGLRNGSGRVLLAEQGQAPFFQYLPYTETAVCDMLFSGVKVGPAIRRKAGGDAFKPGAAWTGERAVGPKKQAKQECSLRVAKRTGKTFEGELTVPGEGGTPTVVKVAGTAATAGDGPVRFTAGTAGGPRQVFRGDVRGGALVLGFEGTDETGKRVFGSATLNAKK